MDLVLDIGNFRLKGAFFEGENIVDSFICELKKEPVAEKVRSHIVESTLISSVNPEFEPIVFEALRGIPYELLDFSKVKVVRDVDEPDKVGHDRIANVYGALHHFPQNDCVVVDLGSAVTFDYVSRDGKYTGGAIYPGMHIGAKALAQYTSKLSEAKVTKPPFAVAKTTETQSGLYWGLLGAVERITFEMRSSSKNPSNVKVIATGGLLHLIGPESFIQDLSDLVDLIDPQLTLIGIHEIMKELKKNA